MIESPSTASLSVDGLVTPAIGPWGQRKYLLVSNYAEIFANSMKQKWHCRVYIDLFAGAGRSKIEDTNRIVLASPILSLEIPDRFDRYIFCEREEIKINALQKRVERDYPNVDVQYLHGDSNQLVSEIMSRIPRHSKDYRVLSFCFADPFNMKSLDFSTIEQLAERFMDFLILIPTGIDASRNLDPHYLKHANKTVDRFLGMTDWREQWREAEFKQKFDVFLTNTYGQRMQTLGYNYQGIESTQLIRGTEKNIPLYRLAFFSRHQLGERFWKETKKYSDPQMKMF